jgi:hypothetical protein
MRNDKPMKLTFAAGTRRQALLSEVDLASVREAASNQEERGGPSLTQKRGRDDARVIELLISRFDPPRDGALREQRYEITERPDWSVLDTLN